MNQREIAPQIFISPRQNSSNTKRRLHRAIHETKSWKTRIEDATGDFDLLFDSDSTTRHAVSRQRKRRLREAKEQTVAENVESQRYRQKQQEQAVSNNRIMQQILKQRRTFDKRLKEELTAKITEIKARENANGHPTGRPLLLEEPSEVEWEDEQDFTEALCREEPCEADEGEIAITGRPSQVEVEDEEAFPEMELHVESNHFDGSGTLQRDEKPVIAPEALGIEEISEVKVKDEGEIAITRRSSQVEVDDEEGCPEVELHGESDHFDGSGTLRQNERSSIAPQPLCREEPCEVKVKDEGEIANTTRSSQVEVEHEEAFLEVELHGDSEHFDGSGTCQHDEKPVIAPIPSNELDLPPPSSDAIQSTNSSEEKMRSFNPLKWVKRKLFESSRKEKSNFAAETAEKSHSKTSLPTNNDQQTLAQLNSISKPRVQESYPELTDLYIAPNPYCNDSEDLGVQAEETIIENQDDSDAETVVISNTFGAFKGDPVQIFTTEDRDIVFIAENIEMNARPIDPSVFNEAQRRLSHTRRKPGILARLQANGEQVDQAKPTVLLSKVPLNEENGTNEFSSSIPPSPASPSTPDDIHFTQPSYTTEDSIVHTINSENVPILPTFVLLGELDAEGECLEREPTANIDLGIPVEGQIDKCSDPFQDTSLTTTTDSTAAVEPTFTGEEGKMESTILDKEPIKGRLSVLGQLKPLEQVNATQIEAGPQTTPTTEGLGNIDQSPSSSTRNPNTTGEGGHDDTSKLEDIPAEKRLSASGHLKPMTEASARLQTGKIEEVPSTEQTKEKLDDSGLSFSSPATNPLFLANLGHEVTNKTEDAPVEKRLSALGDSQSMKEAFIGLETNKIDEGPSREQTKEQLDETGRFSSTPTTNPLSTANLSVELTNNADDVPVKKRLSALGDFESKKEAIIRGKIEKGPPTDQTIEKLDETGPSSSTPTTNPSSTANLFDELTDNPNDVPVKTRLRALSDFESKKEAILRVIVDEGSPTEQTNEILDENGRSSSSLTTSPSCTAELCNEVTNNPGYVQVEKRLSVRGELKAKKGALIRAKVAAIEAGSPMEQSKEKCHGFDTSSSQTIKNPSPAAEVSEMKSTNYDQVSIKMRMNALGELKAKKREPERLKATKIETGSQTKPTTERLGDFDPSPSSLTINPTYLGKAGQKGTNNLEGVPVRQKLSILGELKAKKEALLRAKAAEIEQEHLMERLVKEELEESMPATNSFPVNEAGQEGTIKLADDPENRKLSILGYVKPKKEALVPAKSATVAPLKVTNEKLEDSDTTIPMPTTYVGTAKLDNFRLKRFALPSQLDAEKKALEQAKEGQVYSKLPDKDTDKKPLKDGPTVLNAEETGAPTELGASRKEEKKIDSYSLNVGPVKEPVGAKTSDNVPIKTQLDILSDPKTKKEVLKQAQMAVPISSPVVKSAEEKKINNAHKNLNSGSEYPPHFPPSLGDRHSGDFAVKMKDTDYIGHSIPDITPHSQKVITEHETAEVEKAARVSAFFMAGKLDRLTGAF